MKTDPTSLELLHDIIAATPAPWWPLAPGWLGLLAIATILIACGCIWGLIHRQQNRYRHEALTELAQLESKATTREQQHSTLCDMSTLLKRTALTAFPRPEVATLTGSTWFAFLDGTADTHFSQGLGQKLESAVYQITDSPLSDSDISALASEIRAWIRQHRQTTEPDNAILGTASSKQETA